MSVSARGAMMVLGCAVMVGCAINAKPDFDSAVPQDRYLAIRQAASTGDEAALPDLVRQLSSDDTLVRLSAIDALESITGETRGYDPHAREIERREAIDRWTQWLESAQTGADDEEAAR